MRIIDKTPFVAPDGTINVIDRIKGTLQNGFSWYPDLQAQQSAIALLDKHLDKKFTLIRNQTLGKSKITLPLTLIGPDGIHVLYVTHLSGMYRAKGDIWGELSGSKFKQAGINLLTRTAQFGRVLDVYFRKQGFDNLPSTEPVLLSVNPGLHIDSVRPIVRVVMSDAVQRFASSLMQSPPVISLELVHELADILQHPRSSKTPQAAQTPSPDDRSLQGRLEGTSPASPDTPPAEISFAFEEGENARPATAQAPAIPRPAAPKPAPSRVKKVANSYLGMTGKQFALLGAMAGMVVCILSIFIILILIKTPSL
ncbi:MAG: hypothetical protein L3J16_06135 [Anaerolineales bacterium]|nr:hypothetical protein [Anaerolineales bacterium]